MLGRLAWDDLPDAVCARQREQAPLRPRGHYSAARVDAAIDDALDVVAGNVARRWRGGRHGAEGRRRDAARAQSEIRIAGEALGHDRKRRRLHVEPWVGLELKGERLARDERHSDRARGREARDRSGHLEVRGARHVPILSPLTTISMVP